MESKLRWGVKRSSGVLDPGNLRIPHLCQHTCHPAARWVPDRTEPGGYVEPYPFPSSPTAQIKRLLEGVGYFPRAAVTDANS